MGSLEDLQIDENNIELYTTSYVNVSNYKSLRIISTFSNAGYLYIYHSLDGKKDTLTNTYLCNTKPSVHKLEVVADYIRICVATMNQNELIDKVTISVKGRRSVNSNLFNLLEKLQPPHHMQEIEKDIILSEQPKPEKPEKPEKQHGIYKRLGINTKQKEKPNNNSCRVPELLLRGQILFVRDMGRVDVLPPPVSDGQNYILMMRDKVPFWGTIDDVNNEGWFKN